MAMIEPDVDSLTNATLRVESTNNPAPKSTSGPAEIVVSGAVVSGGGGGGFFLPPPPPQAVSRIAMHDEMPQARTHSSREFINRLLVAGELEWVRRRSVGGILARRLAARIALDGVSRVRPTRQIGARKRDGSMIEIDGSKGEGGGQILRSSLSLAIVTQQSFRIVNIRANREKPGLMRQHLTAVNAAATICDAEVDGAEMGSRTLTFRPGRLSAGNYSFAIGTAGSCTLVFQTVIPALLTAVGESRVRITGGTHNRSAPPFDFLARSFLPQLERMGAKVELELVSHGFFPRGGGEIRALITPAARLGALQLHERGALVRGYAEAYVAAIPLHVAQRELDVIRRSLGWTQDQLHLRALPNDVGPGNALTITLEYENVTEVFTGFGERGVRAEMVAGQAADEARAYLSATAPVGEHLADQLLLPMALGEGGSFIATQATPHLRSNIDVIERFTARRIGIEPTDGGFLIQVG